MYKRNKEMSKYSLIADQLKQEIIRGDYEKEGRLPTEFDLVNRFSVSRQTIRQAISSLKAQGIVYQVQGSGTYIANPEPAESNKFESAFKNIFVLCTYISDYIFPSIIRGIASTLNGTGYRVNIAATGNKVDVERRILEDIIKLKECDGIIVEGSKTGFPNPNIGLYKRIHEMGIPYVFLHCAYQEMPETVVVGMDEKAGGKLAVKKLIDMGCKKIMGIFKSDDRQGLLRYAGFYDGLIESGLGLENIEVRWYTTEDVNDHGMRIDKSMIKIIMELGIEGIVCYNDQVASAIIRDFTKGGFPIPDLVSFDDSYLRESSPHHFDSLGHRKEELGVIAANKIRNMVEGREETSTILDWL